MCKKSIYKKNFLLCTIAGTLIFSYSHPTYANISPPQISESITLKEGEESFDNVFVRDKGPGVSAVDKAVVTITNATIHTESGVLSASKGGRINAKKIVANTIYKGLDTTNGIINVKDSIITVQRGGGAGIVVYETKDYHIKEGETVLNKVVLNNTKLFVEDGTGILGPYCSKAVAEIQLKNSEIHADVLLRNKTKRRYYDDDTLPVTLSLTADNSIIEGRTRTLKINTTVLNLNNHSKWYLNVAKEDADIDFSVYNYDLTDIKQRALSTVSILNLNNSSIIFNAPHKLAKGYYQTLSVGRTAEVSRPSDSTLPNIEPLYKAVYNATGNAEIHFNTEWSDGLPKEQQKTDRLLVHGSVSGTTVVHINGILKDETSNKDNSVPANMRGLSLIQVSGKVDENAFKLANGYIIMGELPYKYVLNAYGPTSSHGKADENQSHLKDVSQESEENTLKDYTKYTISDKVVVGVPEDENAEQNPLREDQNFWDFRLQSATVDDEGRVKALVPQVASYLAMPNALFSVGFADISNQNTLLDSMWIHNEEKDNKKKGILLSSYGNKITLYSSRTPLQYGYNADVRYAALQAGIILAALEEQNVTTSFGLLGTYGKLAFTPKDIEDVKENKLDKWSIAAYGSLRHNSGISVDALFSYGALKGNISTALRGNTAELNNANTLSASATIKQKLETNAKGLTFEPQAQFVYQRLVLGTLSDVDGLNVHIGHPHQWFIRLGGCLIQNISTSKESKAVSLYGKLNVVKTFSDHGKIRIGDTFHFESMGSFLEGGVGVRAQLSQNISLHGDVNYQQKLQKAGISGASFSGGIRYQF
ncbi:outer membrane autotransporter protein [Bartonella silvatica]|uniref:Outer membrane autotransporter protein n=1 Tax=Bartonella silvatica TaxID=357760 RepID=A0ABV2HGQ6_9HYPH